MLTRRTFGGLASCALCSVAGFSATQILAQEAPVTATPGVTRKIFSQIDGPAPGYVTMVVGVEIKAGAIVARHTHPGIESGYVLEGSLLLPVEGRPTRMLNPGDTFQVPPYIPHAGGKLAETDVKLANTYVLEKGKPFASPA